MSPAFRSLFFANDPAAPGTTLTRNLALSTFSLGAQYPGILAAQPPPPAVNRRGYCTLPTLFCFFLNKNIFSRNCENTPRLEQS